jgi:hypothetical protein
LLLKKNVLSAGEGEIENSDLQAALAIFDELLNNTLQPEELPGRPELDRLRLVLLQHKAEISANRTSRLWLQYMDMVEILRCFLRAERMGNWLHHLQALKDMLPYLAAAGHNLYAKSLSLYLQDMAGLPSKNPKVYQDFLNGHHVLRRSDRFWAGLSTDLMIEQMLMRSVKSSGGLTRGRGMSESQRALWLLSMPACGDISSAMQEATDMEFFTSEQHTESTTARMKRDDKDMKELLKYMLPRNPFTFNLAMSLRSISTGVTADPTTNVDRAKDIGLSIVESMVGKAVSEFKFKKKDQAVTMDVKRCARVDGERLQVDPQLLFQRLVTAAVVQREDGDLRSVFEYELSALPSALFESSGLLREATKSKLAESLPHQKKPTLDDDSKYVLDGGSLLHRIPWRKGDTFRQICETYSEYVCRHFAESIVVFDGYGSGPTTKDQVHLRRSSGIIGPEVHNLSPDKRLSFSKDVFLSNNSNKQAFVYLLSEALEASGCNVLHATGDADTLIVRTALKTSIDSNTFVIGEDTDLLVLLCHHIDQDKKCVYFRSYKTTTKQKQWHIQEVQQHLGPEACHLLPFLHAVNGCDTTSRLFGTGKGAPLKKVKITGDTGFKRAGNIFCSTGQNQQTVVEAGEKALVALLNGKPGDSLDVLRYQRFTEKSATAATAVQIHTLPPTSAAAKYHSLRVYFQVQEWICLEQKLDPLDWGWSLSNGRLEPKTTDRPPAPESLLRVVRCDCSTSNCRTKQCTCKGLGLECTLACGECKGLSCENSPHIEELDVPDIMDSTDVHTAPLPDLGDLSDFLRVLH